jgi:V/A-type H+/Na+-transporting ATPase subunit E
LQTWQDGDVVAYENLLKSVEEGAQERERELREKAQQQAAGIRAEAKKQAAEIQVHLVNDAKKSAAIERNKQLYLAKGELKEQALRNRESQFRAAFDEAEKQLSGIREDTKYPAIFEQLAREATGAMGEAPFEVHVDKRDQDLCKKTLAALGIRCGILADIECVGGLVASSPDGLVTISNTVESRLERIKEHKRLEIYAILAGG